MSKKVANKKNTQVENNSESDSEDEQLELKSLSLTSLKEIFKTFWTGYKQKTPKKIKLMDAFVIYCLMLILIQFFYYFVVGNFPQNSLIIGIFTPLGSAVLTGSSRFLTLIYLQLLNKLVCLRQQINEKTRYMNQSSDRSFWEYFLSMYIMFLACINFLG